MEKTTNLGLLKPAQEDFYNVDDFNANADILDNQIQTVKKDYVKKSGDTLTGTLTSSKPYITSNQLAIAHKVDGDKNYYNGGCLFLFSPDDPTYNGGFELRAYNANDNENYIGLRGKLDGQLTWKGKNIVRSVNGVNADSNGDVSITTIANATNATKTTQDSEGNIIKDTYVKKTGDTLTGGLVSNSAYYTSNQLALAHYEKGGYDGGNLFLFPVDNSGYCDGGFSLRAKNDSDFIGLNGNINGSLTWNGKNIVRSVNGTNADINGNVSVNLDGNYVKKTGDTVSGTLTFTVNNAIKHSTDNGCTDIYGGTTWLKGGGLSAIGKDASSNAGNFDLWASDGTNHKHLVGKPNGELTWDLKHVVRSVNGVYADSNGNVSLPRVLNYSNRIEFTGDNVTYTCPSDGWIFMSGVPSATIDKYDYIKVNDVVVGISYHYRDEMWNNGINVQMMVTKGDVVTTDVTLNGGRYFFVPFK